MKNLKVLIVVLITICNFLQVFSQNKKQQIEQLTFQLDSLKNKNNDISIELKNVSNSLVLKTQIENQLKAKIDSIIVSNSMLMTELKSQFTKDLDQIQNKLNALQVENEKYSNELKTKKEELIFSNHNLTLTNLIWRVNDWYKNQDIILFEFIEKNGVILGIDWEKTNAIISMMKENGFFTDNFILTYQNKAANFDTEIKKIKKASEIDLFNLIGEVDYFCNCQDDMMLNYEIHGLKIKNQTANFYWMLEGDDETIQNLIKSGDTDLQFLKYNITAKLVDGRWKIDTMEGFEN